MAPLFLSKPSTILLSTGESSTTNTLTSNPPSNTPPLLPSPSSMANLLLLHHHNHPPTSYYCRLQLDSLMLQQPWTGESMRRIRDGGGGGAGSSSCKGEEKGNGRSGGDGGTPARVVWCGARQEGTEYFPQDLVVGESIRPWDSKTSTLKPSSTPRSPSTNSLLLRHAFVPQNPSVFSSPVDLCIVIRNTKSVR